MTAIEIQQPKTAIVEKHDASRLAPKLSGIQRKAAELAASLSESELQECRSAFETINEIYPLLRLDTQIASEESYEVRRADFKNVIDRLECALSVVDKYCPEEVPIFHKFTPGMYIREIHVPAGTIFTSVTHKTQHPFVISKGVCDICNEVGEVTRYGAPHTGVTHPGTRRVFLVHSDLVFTTFHVTDITDPDEWILANTAIENETLPEETRPKCFMRKELKWPV